MLETSHSLLEQLKRTGDTQWQQLADLYTPLLRSWLRRYEHLSSADADDLIQEVLLTVSQELPKFEHNQRRGAFRRWLRQILVNRLQNFWRTRQHQPAVIGGSDFARHLDELQDDASAASQLWDREHDLWLMHKLLDAVRPHFAEQTWQAFYLQVIEGKSADQAANVAGVSLNSAYVARSRVLQALRKIADGLTDF